MKLKNIIPMSVIGVFSVGILTSCDSGGGDSVVSNEVLSIDLPDNPDEANDENTGAGATDSGANTALEQNYGDQVFAGINAERVSNGLTPLIRDSQMDDLAAGHNAYMIGLASPGGSIVVNHDNAQDRANANAARGFTRYGGNTGGIRGYGSSQVPSVFVNGWVTSPGHFKNIIGDYTHTGLAVSVDPRDGTLYSTQIFAK